MGDEQLTAMFVVITTESREQELGSTSEVATMRFSATSTRHHHDFIILGFNESYLNPASPAITMPAINWTYSQQSKQTHVTILQPHTKLQAVRMTSRTNPQNFSFRPRDEEAENTSRQSEQSNPSTGFTRVDRDQQGDIASSGEDLSRRDSESWDPLLNSAGRDERREPPSSRYAFTHDQLAHPDE